MAQHTEATTLQRQAEALNWASAATTPEATTLQPLTACQTKTLDLALASQHQCHITAWSSATVAVRRWNYDLDLGSDDA